MGRSSENLTQNTIKFVCSYGGRILPRYPDGKLRYNGGESRVLSVGRSISFSELMIKVGEMYGMEANLRCQLPNEDLDALISITSDEDLNNLIEEYDRADAGKIKAFLTGPKKSASSSSSSSSSSDTSPKFSTVVPRRNPNLNHRKPPAYPVGKIQRYQYGNCANQVYLVHNGIPWQ